MTEKSTIESLRDYIEQCPHIEDYCSLLVDRLEDEIGSYSIEPSPCEPIVKRYVNGVTVRQYEFIFASREAYTQEVLDEISNSSFYERFAAWLEQQSKAGNLPILASNQKAIKIEALTTGYAAVADETKARYVIQCKLTYMQA